ncbi:MAG: dynamin family protein [Gemmatimonadaceae bacterium]
MGFQSIVQENPLERLASLASMAGVAQIADEARALATRVAEGRFYLACVGQFKRGKSSLLDALLHEVILPIGVVPVTALPTVVRYGTARSARVLLRGSDWRQLEIIDLSSYVSEEENPENEKGVAAIEVFVPSELLATGMCLVDTPGIGSVFEANSAATYELVPHIDAALVVLGADPPISGEELALITRISQRVDDLLFVLNKADRVSKAELASAKQFACRMLGARLDRPIEIYEVSAKEELEGSHGTREWSAFTVALNHTLAASGRQLVWLAQKRGMSRLTGWLLVTIEEERRVLVEPLADSEASLQQLAEYIARAEQAIDDLGLLFLGEQERLTQRLEERRQKFIASVLRGAQSQLAEQLPFASSFGPACRRFSMQAALDIARKHVVPWLSAEEENVNDEYAGVTERFTALANEFLGELAEAGIPHLRHIAESIEECGKLTSRSRFQFHQLLHLARPASPLRHAADLILAAVGLRRMIRRDAQEFLVKLLDVNTSRVQGDLENRLAVARRELEHGVRDIIVKVRDAARDTLVRTREVREAGEPATSARLATLAEIESEVRTLARETSLLEFQS